MANHLPVALLNFLTITDSVLICLGPILVPDRFVVPASKGTPTKHASKPAINCSTDYHWEVQLYYTFENESHKEFHCQMRENSQVYKSPFIIKKSVYPYKFDEAIVIDILMLHSQQGCHGQGAWSLKF